MKKLRDIAKQKAQQVQAQETLLMLNFRNEKPELFKLFTEDAESCHLHYSEDDSIRGFSKCLVEDCPFCKVGEKPTEYLLLPVYSVSLGAVAILRLPTSDAPFSLLPQILHYLDDPEVAKCIIEATRKGFHYSLRPLKSDSHASLGSEQIAHFLGRVKRGEVDLGKAYPTHSLEILRAAPQISRRLEVLET